MTRRKKILLAALVLSIGGAGFVGFTQEGGITAVPTQIVNFAKGILGMEVTPDWMAEAEGEVHADVAHEFDTPVEDFAAGEPSGATETAEIESTEEIDPESIEPETDSVAYLSGTVLLQEDGTPVGDVHVVASFLAEEASRVDRFEVQTDTEGHFQIGLPTAQRLVGFQVLAGEESTPLHDQGFDLWVREGEDEEIELQVTRGATVEGVVLNPLGHPVEGAEVRVWCRGRESVDSLALPEPDRFAETDHAGRFSIHAIGPEFVISAHADGFAAGDRWHGTIESGETRGQVSLHLDHATACHGVVLNPDGEPIEGVALMAIPASRFSEAGSEEGFEGIFRTGPAPSFGFTDDDGAFSIDTLVPEAYVIEAFHPDFPTWRTRITPQNQIVEVQLRRGAQLTGRLVDQNGAPVNGAEVMVRDTEWRWTTTGEDGRFDIQGLTPGLETRVHAICSDFAMRVETPVTVLNDAPVHVQYELEKGSQISGRITDMHGNSIAGAEVSIRGDRFVTVHEYPRTTWEESMERNVVHTGPSGEFSFDSLYEGEYAITVRDTADERLKVEHKANAGDTGLEIALDPMAMRKVAFVGQVRDAITYEPVTEFSIVVVPVVGDAASEGILHNFVDPAGSFEIVSIDEGETALSFIAEGYSAHTIGSRHYSTGDHPHDVKLLPERDLTFQVIDQHMEPVSGARVSFTDHQNRPLLVPIGHGASATSITTNSEGMGTVAGLPAAGIRLFVEIEGQSEAFEFNFDLTAPLPETQSLGIFLAIPTETARVAVLLYEVLADGEFQAPEGEITAAWLEQVETSGKVRQLIARTNITAMTATGDLAGTATCFQHPEGGFFWESGSENGMAYLPMAWMMVPATNMRFEAHADGFHNAFFRMVPDANEEAETVALFLRRNQ